MLLNGAELAGYIKERQAKEVRRLKQAHGINPALAIIQDHPDPVIDTYVKLKLSYAQEIGVETTNMLVSATDLAKTIKHINQDDKYHGVIVQLPLAEPGATNKIVNLISPDKDVDGLGDSTKFQPAAVQAILWLLAGYGIELHGRQVAVVGRGRLVGAPLIKELVNSGVEPLVIEESKGDLSRLIEADVIISAAGQPGLIDSKLVKPGAVVVDAGTSSEGGSIRGDASEELYQRTDINLTPRRGGVGPLTVASLFDNLLRAARARMAAP